MHRLGLLGLSAAAASSLLAACSKEPAAPAPATSTTGAPTAGTATPSAATSAVAAPAPGTPGLPTEAITLPGPEGRKLSATWAAARAPRGAVLVLHENKGLTEHFRALPGRFAAAGYSALALDLLSEEGGTASLGDPGNATAALGKVAPERFVADMRAALDELARRAPGRKLGAIGFCFGGGIVNQLAVRLGAGLNAGAPFYGAPAGEADVPKIVAPLMLHYADRTKDAGIGGRFPAYEAAAKLAWQRTLDFFNQHLRG